MFHAFTSIDAPHSNLAEVVHAGWKNKGDIKISILNCCYFDVMESLALSVHLDQVRMGTYGGGRGRSEHKRKKKKLANDVEMATRLGQDILDYNDYSMSKTGNKLSSVQQNSA